MRVLVILACCELAAGPQDNETRRICASCGPQRGVSPVPVADPSADTEYGKEQWARPGRIGCIGRGTACDTRWARSQEAVESGAQHINSLMP